MNDLADQLKGVIAKLEQNQQRDIHNSAQIYGIAAQAVELNRQLLQKPGSEGLQAIGPVTEAILKKRFKTAKAAATALAEDRGIELKGRLRWAQVVAAWNQPVEGVALTVVPSTSTSTANPHGEILIRLDQIEVRLNQIEVIQQKILDVLNQLIQSAC